jgi:hypothetical protein
VGAEEPTVLELGEPLGRDRRACHVPAQALEAATITGRDGHVRVQAHAARARAALALARRDALRVDAVAHAQHALGYVASEPDPQCIGKPWKNKEKTGVCGFELALILPGLMWLHRRRRRLH